MEQPSACEVWAILQKTHRLKPVPLGACAGVGFVLCKVYGGLHRRVCEKSGVGALFASLFVERCEREPGKAHALAGRNPQNDSLLQSLPRTQQIHIPVFCRGLPDRFVIWRKFGRGSGQNMDLESVPSEVEK